mgnify:CR=1 FL=1
MVSEEYIFRIEDILITEIKARDYYSDFLLIVGDEKVKEIISIIEKEEEDHVKAVESVYLKYKKH